MTGRPPHRDPEGDRDQDRDQGRSGGPPAGAERDVAEIMDSVSWDYDPGSEAVSPLVPTERYFRDFPWEGEPDDEL